MLVKLKGTALSCRVPRVINLGHEQIRINTVRASASVVDSFTPELIVAGGSILAGLVGLAGWQMSKSMPEQVQVIPTPESTAPEPEPPLPRENAVLVLGATGRVGRRVVAKLLQSGRTVIAAVRSTGKAKETFGANGLKEGLQEDSTGLLFIEGGVDVTSPETLDRAELWKGVTQIVSLLGPSFGPQPDGSMGYNDNMTPERVEAGGWDNLAAILNKHLPKQQRASVEILSMRTSEDLSAWQRLDDVIMGGQSSSRMELRDTTTGASSNGSSAATTTAGAVWRGDLIVEGGGFCGCRTRPMNLDLSSFDGIHIRVKGDGQIFKMNIKTVDQLNSPEYTYQTTFDTVPGQWSDVYLPWHNFVSVKMAQHDPEGAPLDPSKVATLGLVLSRFEFNKMPNPMYKPGPFELEIQDGISVYADARPQIVLISSAGVERNAIIGDDAEKRKKDIPIVQLNPGGTLNYKYQAEAAVRASGYPYSVIRSTGMIDSNEGGPFQLEADQGDSMSGYMGRDDVADLIVATLSLPEACSKTYEVRRSEAADRKGKPMDQKLYRRMFMKLVEDRNRWRIGLGPMPKVVPPPPPPTQERVGEILNQVKQVRESAAVTTSTAP